MGNDETSAEDQAHLFDGFEQQNLRLVAPVKRYLEKLAAESGISVPRYCADVLSSHVVAKRGELADLYRAEAKRATEVAEELSQDFDGLSKFLSTQGSGRSESRSKLRKSNRVRV